MKIFTKIVLTSTFIFIFALFGFSIADAITNQPIQVIQKSGEPGKNGTDGTNGTNGANGIDGKDGKDGSKGDTGARGPMGLTGAVGPQGLQGPQGPQGEQGETGPVGPTGASGLNWRGTWASDVNYELNDAVSFGNSSWFAAVDPETGEVPDENSSYWVPLALQGATGPMGPTGVVAATAPLIYSSGTQELSLDLDAFDHLGTLDYLQFNTDSEPANSPGRLLWNKDDGTLNLQGIGGGITYQIGQENAQYVTNQSGTNIANGMVVRVNGTSGGNRMLVQVATSETAVGATGVLGLATQDINTGDAGYVTTYGVVHGLDTRGLSAGLPVYLGANGTLTNTWPANGIVVQLGYVLVGNSSNLGSIFVAPQLNLTPPIGGICYLPAGVAPGPGPGVYEWYNVGGRRYVVVCNYP
ncbi:MAG: hypothetical protein ACKOOE_00820 [Micrococcales bacterium]